MCKKYVLTSKNVVGKNAVSLYLNLPFFPHETHKNVNNKIKLERHGEVKNDKLLCETEIEIYLVVKPQAQLSSSFKYRQKSLKILLICNKDP